MLIEVSNYRKIQKAKFKLDGICVVGGHNAQGKTTVAHAVAMLLTQNNDMMGYKKSDVSKLIHDGKKEANLAVSDGASSFAIHISAKNKNVGTSIKDIPPTASAHAVGLINFMQMKQNERALFVGEQLRADPTIDDLKNSLDEAGINLSDDKLKNLWTLIDRDGWDATAQKYKDHATELKGAWREITKETWGVQKAEGWTPEDFIDGDEDANITDLISDEEHWDKEFHKTSHLQGAAEKEREILEIKASKYEEIGKEYKNLLDKELPEYEARFDKIVAELEAMPDTNDASGFPCPHCDEKITKKKVKDGVYQYVKFEKIPDDELKALRKKHATLSGEKDHVKADIDRVKDRIGQLKVTGKEAQNAKEKLIELKKKTPAKEGDDIESVKLRLEAAKERVLNVQSYISAKEKHKAIQKTLAIKEVLDPKGVRLKKLTEVLDSFVNDFISPLCEAMKTQSIIIDTDMNVSMGGRDYVLLSESEKFRVRAALQVAFAQISKDAAVVLDGADIIVSNKRGQLLNMLVSAGLPVLLTMAVANKESVPEAVNKVGQRLWIENGIMEKY